MAHEAIVYKAFGLLFFLAAFCSAVYGITLAMAVRSESLTAEAYLVMAVFLMLCVRVFQTEKQHSQG